MNPSSIGTKLYLGFLVVLIVMTALVLSSWQSLRQLHEANELNAHPYVMSKDWDPISLPMLTI